MSLDKAITHGKEKRKPYRGSKAIDCTCRNHGSCPWCVENRTHKFRDKESDTMRIEVHYFADDDTEFDTEEECMAYEAKQMEDFKSVLFFDDAFNHLDIPSQNTFECAMYLKILNGERASRLMRWQWGYFGVNMDGLPESLQDGELYAWDNDYGEWYNPKAKLEKYRTVADAIEKAVNSVG